MAKKNKRAYQPAPVSSAPATRVEFNPDYSLVKRDLKRIASLAGAFVVILIALSFFLK
jgi:hypothetical protein